MVHGIYVLPRLREATDAAADNDSELRVEDDVVSGSIDNKKTGRNSLSGRTNNNRNQTYYPSSSLNFGRGLRCRNKHGFQMPQKIRDIVILYFDFYGLPRTATGEDILRGFAEARVKLSYIVEDACSNALKKKVESVALHIEGLVCYLSRVVVCLTEGLDGTERQSRSFGGMRTSVNICGVIG